MPFYMHPCPILWLDCSQTGYKSRPKQAINIDRDATAHEKERAAIISLHHELLEQMLTGYCKSM